MPDNVAEDLSELGLESRRAFLLGGLLTAAALSLFATLRRTLAGETQPAEPASQSAVFLGPFPQDHRIVSDDSLTWVSELKLYVCEWGGKGRASVRYWWTGAPQSVGTLRVTLIGFDSHGERILDQSQLCYDARGAANAANSFGLTRMVGAVDINYFFPTQMLPDLAKIKVVLERAPSSLSA